MYDDGDVSVSAVIELTKVQDMTLREFIRLFDVDKDLSLSFTRLNVDGALTAECTVRIGLNPTDVDGDMSLRIEAT